MHSSLSTHVKRYKPWREQMRRKTALGQKPQAVASLSFVCFRGARVFSFREIQNIIYTESICIHIYIYMNCWFSIARFRLLEAFVWPQKCLLEPENLASTRWTDAPAALKGGRLVSKICRTWSCSIWLCVWKYVEIVWNRISMNHII